MSHDNTKRSLFRDPPEVLVEPPYQHHLRKHALPFECKDETHIAGDESVQVLGKGNKEDRPVRGLVRTTLGAIDNDGIRELEHYLCATCHSGGNDMEWTR